MSTAGLLIMKVSVVSIFCLFGGGGRAEGVSFFLAAAVVVLLNVLGCRLTH